MAGELEAGGLTAAECEAIVCAAAPLVRGMNGRELTKAFARLRERVH